MSGSCTRSPLPQMAGSTPHRGYGRGAHSAAWPAPAARSSPPRVVLAAFSGLNASDDDRGAGVLRDGLTAACSSAPWRASRRASTAPPWRSPSHRARRRVRARERLRAARRQVRPGDLAVLCAHGRRGVRPAPHGGRSCRVPIACGVIRYVPAVFLLASVGMVGNALMTDPMQHRRHASSIILAGVPAYWCAPGLRGRGEAA